MRSYADAASDVPWATGGVQLAREAVFPALAVALIVEYSDIRIPLGLPGHRGLVWLTSLVAVALVARWRETVVAVGAASTVSTLMLHGVGDAWASTRDLSAAILLYAVATLPWVRPRRWLIVPAAAPIHLVALLGRGQLSAVVSTGVVEKVMCHLGFGLIAGLLGWTIAFGVGGRRE